MQIVVVGAGPAGLFSAIALARRGHRITVVDRDPGPPPHGRWQRKGVMQFHHAHTLRGPVVDALRDEMPDVLRSSDRRGRRHRLGTGRTASGPAVSTRHLRRGDATVRGRGAGDHRAHRTRRCAGARRRAGPRCHVARRHTDRRVGHRRIRSGEQVHQRRARTRRRWRLRGRLHRPAVPIPRRRVSGAGRTHRSGCHWVFRGTSQSRFCTTTGRSPSPSPMTEPTGDCATCGIRRYFTPPCRRFRSCRTGPIRTAPHRSVPCCPAGGCTTAIAANAPATERSPPQA